MEEMMDNTYRASRVDVAEGRIAVVFDLDNSYRPVALEDYIENFAAGRVEVERIAGLGILRIYPDRASELPA